MQALFNHLAYQVRYMH